MELNDAMPGASSMRWMDQDRCWRAQACIHRDDPCRVGDSTASFGSVLILDDFDAPVVQITSGFSKTSKVYYPPHNFGGWWWPARAQDADQSTDDHRTVSN